jgi:hypothetical protein
VGQHRPGDQEEDSHQDRLDPVEAGLDHDARRHQDRAEGPARREEVEAVERIPGHRQTEARQEDGGHSSAH